MVIYTDGSCKNNGSTNSYGGYAVVAMDGNKVLKAYANYSENTTNNREEMKAIIYAIENFGTDKNEDFLQPIIVYSDSMYCINTFSQWMFSWEKNNWKRPRGQSVENLDLVQQYFNLQIDKEIDLRYVKGHNNTIGNELADRLATGSMSTEEIMEKYGLCLTRGEE